MSQTRSTKPTNVTILLSHALGSPEVGKIELGTIAFEVDQKMIDALRRDLGAQKHSFVIGLSHGWRATDYELISVPARLIERAPIAGRA
jgi:hypothetical protein